MLQQRVWVSTVRWVLRETRDTMCMYFSVVGADIRVAEAVESDDVAYITVGLSSRAWQRLTALGGKKRCSCALSQARDADDTCDQ